MAREKAALNNLSADYKKQIDKLINLKETHTFKLLIGKPFKKALPDGTFQMVVMFPASYGLPSRDSVIDPISKESVSIAAISHYDDNDTPVFLQKNVFNESGGFFSFSNTDSEGRKWLEFLYASSYLKENTNRSKRNEPIVGIHDETLEAKMRTMARDEKADALIRQRRMDDKEVVQFAAAMGWDETNDPIILKDQIGAMVENTPGLFLSLVEDFTIEHKSVLKRAITKGLASYNANDNTVYYQDAPIAKLGDPEVGKTYLDEWSKWVVTAPNGIKIFEKMQKEADATQKVAKSA
jgi:hypothetical protein